MLGNSNNHLQLTYICLMKNFLEQTVQWDKQVVVKFEIRMDVGKTSTNILQPSIALELHVGNVFVFCSVITNVWISIYLPILTMHLNLINPNGEYHLN